MNKYYIGYSLPDDIVEKCRELRLDVMGSTALVDVHQLHITALHLGPMVRERAENILLQLPRRSLAVPCELDTYDRFGDALVIKLKENPWLTEIHRQLGAIALKGSQDTWGYNPHITLAHGKKGFIRVGCPEATFALRSISLFEKHPGGEYAPHMTTEFR
jgi:2'-5' RNA ligase